MAIERPPSPDEIRDHLKKVLESPPFRGALLCSKLLDVLVTEDLNGKPSPTATDLSKMKEFYGEPRSVRARVSDIRKHLLTFDSKHRLSSDLVKVEIPEPPTNNGYKPRYSWLLPMARSYSLVIPGDPLEISEFNRELQFRLYQRLFEERCSLTDSMSSVDGMDAFRRKLHDLQHRSPHPDRLLIIWPEVVKDDDPQGVLAPLRQLAKSGCCIAALNEFPNDELPGFDGRLRLIKTNVDAAFRQLAGYIKRRFNGGRALVIDASDSFHSAVERKSLFAQHLKEMQPDHVSINSWDYQETREALLCILQKKITERQDQWDYDVVVAANDAMGLGAADALDEFCWCNDHIIGKGAKVLQTRTTGFDGLPSAIRRLKQPKTRFVATMTAGPKEIVDALFNSFKEGRASDPICYVAVSDNALRTDNHPEGERVYGTP